MLLKLSPHCPFQKNLMACNKKMSVLLSIENLTVCGIFHMFLKMQLFMSIFYFILFNFCGILLTQNVKRSA